MKRILSIVSLSSLISLALTLAPAGQEEVIEKLEAYVNNFPQEKVYLHLDKPYYTTGQDIWFKAYLVDAFDPSIAPLSKVVEVELIDTSLKVLERRKIKLNQQGGAGHFVLPDSLAAGDYTLRAYTNWNRNFDEAFFFSKTIQVFNGRNEQSQIPHDPPSTEQSSYAAVA